MAVAIKLIRIGKKGKPNYRIVAIDKREKRNAPYLEKLGFYDPTQNPPKLLIDTPRLKHWIEKGAQLSEGINKLKSYLKKDLSL